MKQHHIPLPVRSDIKRFEDTLPVAEKNLEVLVFLKVKACLQIRIFSGTYAVLCYSDIYFIIVLSNIIEICSSALLCPLLNNTEL